METIGEVFDALVNELHKLYAPEEAASIVRLLFREKLNISRLELATNKGQKINANDKTTLNEATIRLLKGEPVQYIIGSVHFYDCILEVNKNVLIPRPETEELVQLIVSENKDKGELYILDIGTGSGCIAIALARHLPESEVTAIDISQGALELAQTNAKTNHTEIDFINIDILDEEEWKRLGEYNIIVSNPPYVLESEKGNMHNNVLSHEPHPALFVPDNDPLLFYKKIAAVAQKKLAKGGRLYFEINEAMGLEVKKMLEGKGFAEINIRKDLSGKDRFVMGVKEGD